MDRIGITAAGLGHILGPPYALGSVECFYSNEAYAKAGFCLMHLELHPPLETIGDTSTVESLTSYLKSYRMETENELYQTGRYRSIPASEVPPVIEDPSTIGSAASMIVQTAHEVDVIREPRATDIPDGLTSTTYVALVHFADKGNVLFKANNFERHSPRKNVGVYFLEGSSRCLPGRGSIPEWFQGHECLAEFGWRQKACKIDHGTRSGRRWHHGQVLS